MNSSHLKPAIELARAGHVRYPNESAEYRRAREALLAEEIELRRHIERVAEQRRQLPPGGEVTKAYVFEGEGGKVPFAALFSDKPTLVIYSLGSKGARYRAAHRLRVRRAFADRAADRGQEGARLDAA
jgi:predicted dithiol-disulfide oxidoreductase (DUF899 family)